MTEMHHSLTSQNRPSDNTSLTHLNDTVLCSLLATGRLQLEWPFVRQSRGTRLCILYTLAFLRGDSAENFWCLIRHT
jgi:hypothetical protein